MAGGSDDRIDVVVTDGIDPNVDLKLRAIAESADKGQASVLRLKAELASITATPVSKLAAETQTATTTLNKQLTAQSSLTKATEASAASDITAAANKAKVTAALDAEAAAQARLAAVIDKTIARQEAQKVAGASTTFAKGGNPFQAEATAASLAAQAASVGSAAKTMEAGVAEAELASVGRFATIRNAAGGAFDFIRDAIAAQAANFKGFFGSGGVATMEGEVAAVGHVGTAVKTNSRAITESLVLVREGMRGNYSRMAGSASILAAALGVLSAAIPIAIAGLVGLVAAKISLNTETEKDSLTKYAQSLGLTEKEMRKLKDTTVDASGKLKEHNDLQITFGDVFHGVVKTIEEGISSIGSYYGITTNDAKNFTTDAIGFLKDFFSYMVGGVFATGKFIYTEVSNLFTLAYDAGRITGNAIYTLFALVADGVIGLFNGVATVVNSVSSAVGQGDLIKKMGYLDTGVTSLGAGLKSFKGEDFFADVRNGADATNKVLAKTGDNIRGAARERVKAEADAIKANRNPKKGSDPKTKEDFLDDTNKKLDDELSRMHLLKDAREEQQKLDQIEEQFSKRRQPLTAAEIQGFRDKIHAIQEFKYQQQEMDRIYDEFNGASKIYNASLKASDDLLQRGAISAKQFALANAEAAQSLAKAMDPTGASAAKFDLATKLAQIQVALENFVKTNGKFGISQEQAAEETNKANLAYQQAINPLFQLNEQMGVATRAAGLYGDAVQENNYYETIRQALIKAGKPASDTYVKGVNAETDALMKKNKALQQQTYIQSQIGAVVNPILEDAKFLANKANFYAEIDRLRKQDVLNEQQAQQAKYAIQAKYDQIRLSGASQFFGLLAGLSSSGNKKLAAIGKAAAVAQATIDGIMAVQKALSTLPPPWSFAVAAATAAMTGANVAKIISTPVGNFKDGGDFIVQGNAGVDKNNISMNVSRGERVTIQTPQQQREAGKGTQAKPVLVQPKIINIVDPRMALDAMSGREGDGVIMNFIERNADQIKRVVG